MDPQTSPSTPCTTLTTASRDLILQISTDLTKRMNRLLSSNRIAAVDVIPIAKDILDLSTLRCLVAEKRNQRLRRKQQQQQQQQQQQDSITRRGRRGRGRSTDDDRSASMTSTPPSEVPTWEEMDNHVCAQSRATLTSSTTHSRQLNPLKPHRSWTSSLISRRKPPSTPTAEQQHQQQLTIECRCTRALDLMDLEGDVLRSFPDDSGDTLVAPELARWAIGQLRVEAEWTRGMVEELLHSDDESEDHGSPRVDSMEPEEEESSPWPDSPTEKSTKASSSGGTRRVRGWRKSDVDDEGDVLGTKEDGLLKGGDQEEETPDSPPERGQMFSVRILERKRSRVLSGLWRRRGRV